MPDKDRLIDTRGRKWVIRGYDGQNQIFEQLVPFHLLSERQTVELLRRLVAKHLSESEIIDASINRGATSLLEVRRESTEQHYFLSCGENSHYTATVKKT